MVLQSKIDRTSFVLSSYTTSLCIACIRQIRINSHFPHCFRENNTWLFIPCFTVWFVFFNDQELILLECSRLFYYSIINVCCLDSFPFQNSLFIISYYFSFVKNFFKFFFCFYIAVLATFDIIPCHCSNVNLFLFLISATLFILSSFQKKVNNFLLFFLKNFRNFIFYFPFLMFLTIKV